MEQVKEQVETSELVDVLDGPGEDTAQAEETPEEDPQKAINGLKHALVESRKSNKDILESNRSMRARLAEFETMSQIDPEPELPDEKQLSPMDEWESSEDYDPDMPIPGKVAIAERRFQKESVKKASTVMEQRANRIAMERSINVAKALYTEADQGENLGFTTVVSNGMALLTASDQRIIKSAGDQAGEEVYHRCRRRLMASGTPTGNIVKAAYESQRNPKPPTPTPQPNPKKKEGAPPVPTSSEVLGRTVPPAIGRLGLQFGGPP